MFEWKSPDPQEKRNPEFLRRQKLRDKMQELDIERRIAALSERRFGASSLDTIKKAIDLQRPANRILESSSLTDPEVSRDALGKLEELDRFLEEQGVGKRLPFRDRAAMREYPTEGLLTTEDFERMRAKAPDAPQETSVPSEAWEAFGHAPVPKEAWEAFGETIETARNDYYGARLEYQHLYHLMHSKGHISYEEPRDPGNGSLTNLFEHSRQELERTRSAYVKLLNEAVAKDPESPYRKELEGLMLVPTDSPDARNEAWLAASPAVHEVRKLSPERRSRLAAAAAAFLVGAAALSEVQNTPQGPASVQEEPNLRPRTPFGPAQAQAMPPSPEEPPVPARMPPTLEAIEPSLQTPLAQTEGALPRIEEDSSVPIRTNPAV